METTAYTGSTLWHELAVNKIGLFEPFRWLSKGWQDMRAAGRYSFRYGSAIVLISGLLTLGLVVTGKLFLLPFLVAGFYLYQMSAHLEQGEPLKACNAIEAWKRNQAQISMVIAGFFILMQLWIGMNFVLFALLYEGISPPLNNFFSSIFFSAQGRSFAIASFSLGFVLAWCAYAISVLSVQMLIDRDVDGFTAIRFSIKSVLRNMPAMMLWAFLIVVIVGLGLITFYIGLVVALPLIGHASWHAYRALVPSTV